MVTERQLRARIAELTAERQRDALDGQAALDERDARIVELEGLLEEWSCEAWRDRMQLQKRTVKALLREKDWLKDITGSIPELGEEEDGTI